MMSCDICGAATVKRRLSIMPGKEISVCGECAEQIAAFRSTFKGDADWEKDKFQKAFSALSLKAGRGTPAGTVFLNDLWSRYPVDKTAIERARKIEAAHQGAAARQAEEMEENRAKLAEFQDTFFIEGYFSLNEDDRLWCIPQNGALAKLRPLDALMDYEIIENGASIQRGTAGGALIGGLLFGVTGAVVGSSMAKATVETLNSLLIRLTLNDIRDSVDYIRIYDDPLHPLAQGTQAYQAVMSDCQRVASVLHILLHRNRRTASPVSLSEEIARLVQLRDAGALSGEEFQAAKRKVLRL